MDKNQQKIREYVEGYKAEMMAYWKELVNYQAGSKEGERIAALMQQVSARFEREGLSSELLPTGCPIPMLRAFWGKERPGKPILFCGHLDTVFPNGSYPENPFREEDGKVYGPGVCDMKGGVVSLLYIIKILGKMGYDRHPVKVILVGDEETTHEGSRAADMLAEEAAGCLCAFNMETGRLSHEVVVARKGCLDVRITARGRGGHVGNEFTSCANAVEAMAGIVLQLRKLTDLSVGRTVSTDVISGGTISNAVPDSCRIEVVGVDVRQHDGIRAALRLPHPAGHVHKRAVLLACIGRAGALLGEGRIQQEDGAAVEQLGRRVPYQLIFHSMLPFLPAPSYNKPRWGCNNTVCLSPCAGQ